MCEICLEHRVIIYIFCCAVTMSLPGMELFVTICETFLHPNLRCVFRILLYDPVIGRGYKIRKDTQTNAK